MAPRRPAASDSTTDAPPPVMRKIINATPRTFTFRLDHQKGGKPTEVLEVRVPGRPRITANKEPFWEAEVSPEVLERLQGLQGFNRLVENHVLRVA